MRSAASVLRLLVILPLVAFAAAEAADLPPGIFVDIDAVNTTAAAGTPSPFYTDDVNAAGFTSGALWRRRTGLGFTITGAREIFEKDANGGVGDAAGGGARHGRQVSR